MAQAAPMRSAHINRTVPPHAALTARNGARQSRRYLRRMDRATRIPGAARARGLARSFAVAFGGLPHSVGTVDSPPPHVAGDITFQVGAENYDTSKKPHPDVDAIARGAAEKVLDRLDTSQI